MRDSLLEWYCRLVPGTHLRLAKLDLFQARLRRFFSALVLLVATLVNSEPRPRRSHRVYGGQNQRMNAGLPNV